MDKVQEEKWNTITHLLGVLFGVIAFPVLFIVDDFASKFSEYVAIAIYAFSFIFLFISSSIYHYTKDVKRKQFWQKIDHISIYFMISGTYVPFMIKYIEFNTAILFLSIMYTLVFIGSVLKIWFTGKYEIASLILYIFLGWMIIFQIKPFYMNAGNLVMGFVVAGGLAYMIGIYFYVLDKKKYYHTIWHIFVLLGSILHFQGVILS